MSSIRRAGSLKSTKMSRQDSESENDAESERLLSQSRDTVTDIGQTILLQPYEFILARLHVSEGFNVKFVNVIIRELAKASKPYLERHA